PGVGHGGRKAFPQEHGAPGLQTVDHNGRVLIMWSAYMRDVGSNRREQLPMIVERRHAPPLVGLCRRGWIHVAHTLEFDTDEAFDRFEVDDRDVAATDNSCRGHGWLPPPPAAETATVPIFLLPMA